MSYIGNSPTTQSFTPAVDYFSGNGVATSFTLSRTVASVYQIEAIVNNVVQNPSTAYTVSGNTITFTGAPSTGTNNVYIKYISLNNQTIAPGQGTVYTSSLSLSSVTGTGNIVLSASPSFTGSVGIGTTSPAYPLDVAGVAANTISSVRDTTGYALFRAANSSGLTFFGQDNSAGAVSGTANASLVWGNSSVPLLFATNNSLRATLDTNGNFGLGATAPSWGIGGVYSSGSFGTSLASVYGTDISFSAYYSGGAWKYQNSTYAPLWYSQSSGQHKWFIAPTGTTGNSISFTQAMTLNASGQLIVNATSVAGYGGVPPKMELYNTNSYSGDADGGSLVIYGLSNAAGQGGALTLGSSYTTGYGTFARLRGSKNNSTSGDTGGGLAIDTRASGGTFAQVALFDSSGNFGLGQTPIGSINGTVGATINPVGYMQLQRSNAPGCLALNASGSGNTGAIVVFYQNQSSVGSISVGSTSTAFNTTSDPRLKNITGPVTAADAITFVQALKPVTGTWKLGGDLFTGFLTTDYSTVDPTAVIGEANATQPVGNVTDSSGTVLQTAVAQPETLPEGETWTQTGTADVYQQMEYGSSAWCANMTAALQSALTTIATMQATLKAAGVQGF